MKLISYVLIVLFGLLSTKQIHSQETKDISKMVELENLHKIDEGLYRSAQPDEDDFKALEKAGIKEVLNLRRHNSDDDEAEGTSLKLHRVKCRAEALNEKHLLEALRIIKNRKGDMVIHCLHGSDRTGAVVAMYNIIYKGWSKEKAIEDLKNGGYGHHKIFFNIPKLINKIDIEEFKKKLDEEKNDE